MSDSVDGMGQAAQVVQSVTAKTTYAAAGGGVLFGLSANELAAYGSLAIAVLAWITNAAITIHYKQQHLKIARARGDSEGDDE